MKSSEFIQKFIRNQEYDYRDPCGARDCVCYDTDIKLQAIIQYLDEEYDQKNIF